MILRKWLIATLVAFMSLPSWNAFAADLLEVPVGISPVMSSAALYIAKEKGYFKDEGIDVVVKPFKGSGAEMVPFLASGQLFVAGGNVAAGVYNAIANDIPIKFVVDKGTVTPKHGYLALIVRKDHIESGRYKDFKDLKGMTMAVTAKGVSQEIATEKYLQKGGLSLADIKLITLAYSDMNIAMANKSLDAAVQIEPFVAAAVSNNLAARVAGSDEVYPNQQSAVMMYSPIFMEKHPDKAKAFMVAYVKGLRDYNDAFEKNIKRAEIIAILAKSTSMSDPKTYDAVRPVGLHPDGRMDVQSLKDDAQWYLAHGYVKQLPNMDVIVDHSFVDFALRKLGEYK